MTRHACPECGRGTVEKTIRRNFQTKVRGYPFVVPQAEIGVCNNCGREFFGASEVKRWTQLYDEFHQSHLRPQEIAEIREGVGLKIGEFALFLGCTRQTVHNWEKPSRKVPQLGTADLLLRLVKESSRHGSINVVSWLRTRMRELGAEVKAKASACDSRGVDMAETRDFRSIADYDRLFGSSEAPRDVPTLTM